MHGLMFRQPRCWLADYMHIVKSGVVCWTSNEGCNKILNLFCSSKLWTFYRLYHGSLLLWMCSDATGWVHEIGWSIKRARVKQTPLMNATHSTCSNAITVRKLACNVEESKWSAGWNLLLSSARDVSASPWTACLNSIGEVENLAQGMTFQIS